MSKTRKITFTAIFAAIATVLMFFEFPLPFMPPFLKVDLSGAIILIGVFLFGPISAVSMALIKDLIHLLSTTTGGSGELADFIMTCTLVLVAWFIYQIRYTRKSAILGCAIGSIAMALMGMVTNYFIIIPFYSLVMPIEAIISACAQINPFIGSMTGYLVLGVLPFNLLKGIILSILTILLYKKLDTFLNTTHVSIPQGSH